MKRTDVERLLNETEIPGVDPSEELIERVWEEVKPILESRRELHPGAATDGIGVEPEWSELRSGRAGPPTRPRIGPRLLAAAAAGALVVAGLWVVADDGPELVVSVEEPLRQPETSCEILAAELDGLPGGELLDVRGVGRFDELSAPELLALADAVGRFVDGTDPSGIETSIRQMRIIERGLRLAADHRRTGDAELAAATAAQAVNNIGDDNAWLTNGRLSGCFAP